ncbi:MAG: radical SAM protein [Clostridiales bacterium]|nr:radical SAM protein [Clostridiales bacterium]
MKILKELRSEDHSIKYLLKLDDGNTIETLYMHDEAMVLTYHSTVCVSSQVGCNIGCKFCATGEQGFIRNLTADEILEQVVLCNQYRLKSGLIPIDAVVFAGMGEPLLNFYNVRDAVFKIQSQFGIRDFELATVGVVPKIYEFIDCLKNTDTHMRINISIHATTNDQRRKLIPFNSKYGIEELIRAAIDFANSQSNKVRIRYMLLKGFNDSEADVLRLIELLKGKPLKLILSQYNDNHMDDLTPSGTLEIRNFYDKIKEEIDCEIFHNFGGDIRGGCGQLRRHRKIAAQYD